MRGAVIEAVVALLILIGVSTCSAQQCDGPGRGLQLRLDDSGGLVLQGGRGNVLIGDQGVVVNVGQDGLIRVGPQGSVSVDLPRPLIRRRANEPEQRPGFFRRLFGGRRRR